MPQDVSYRQLLQLLSGRAQSWMRYRVEALPAPLPADHPQLPVLLRAYKIVHACSCLRGTTIPLESWLTPRLTADLAETVLRNAKSGRVGDLVLAARLIGAKAADDPALIAHLSALPGGDLRDRLVLDPTPDTLAEVETLLSAMIPVETLTDARIDRFAGLVMQLYDYGASRPQLSSVSAYGDIFANCLHYADWAQSKRRLAPLAQMIFCLCLIDPGHDVAPYIADIMSCQRPDGSFPEKLGYGTSDQGLDDAAEPTITALAALIIAVHRGWSHPATPSAPTGYVLQHC